MVRVLVVLLVLAVARLAVAAPVIESGREKEVLALFAPYELGGEVVSGWKLMNVRVAPDAIGVELEGPNGKTASFRLVHPDTAVPAAPRTRSFAVIRESAADQAIAPLVVAVRRNDAGGFWKDAPAAAPRPSVPEPDDAGGGLWFTLLITALGLSAVWVIARRNRGGPTKSKT